MHACIYSQVLHNAGAHLLLLLLPAHQLLQLCSSVAANSLTWSST
jgi:hypothetical protein